MNAWGLVSGGIVRWLGTERWRIPLPGSRKAQKPILHDNNTPRTRMPVQSSLIYGSGRLSKHCDMQPGHTREEDRGIDGGALWARMAIARPPYLTLSVRN
jgi:hypothetical protein